MKDMYNHQVECRFNPNNKKPCAVCFLNVKGDKWKDHNCITSLALRNFNLAKSYLEYQRATEKQLRESDKRFKATKKCIMALQEQVDVLENRSRLLENFCGRTLAKRKQIAKKAINGKANYCIFL